MAFLVIRCSLVAVLLYVVIAFLAVFGCCTKLQPLRGEFDLQTSKGVTGLGGQDAYLWKHVAVGGGGFITGYDTEATGKTRLVRTDVYGAYIWLADQNRWAQLVTASTLPAEDRVQNGAAEGVFEIVVAPSKPERIYMALKGQVYRSDDRGMTFIRISRSHPFPLNFDPNSEFRNYGPFMAVSPANPDLVLFGTPNDGLLRSENAGATWSKVPSVPGGAALRSRPADQRPGMIVWFERSSNNGYTGRIWVMSAGHGVYASSDSGQTFAPLTASDGAQPKTLKQGVFSPDGTFYAVDLEDQTVWKFADNAWSDLTARSGLGPVRFAAVAVNPGTSQLFVFDEGGRTYRSGDGGKTWSQLSHRSRVGKGDPPWLRVSNQSYFATGHVQLDPVVPNRLWVNAGTGVYYSDISENDFQIVWTSQTRGIEELVANDVIQVPGHSPLFAAWDFGVHLKEDLEAFSTTYGPKERVLIAVQQLDWSPSDPDFVVTNASDTRMSCCWQDGDSVLAGYSLDGGRSWSKFRSLPRPPGTEANDPWRMSFGTIAVSSGNINNIVWEPTFNRSPYYTLDRGVTWKRVTMFAEHLPTTGSHAQYHFNRKTLAADRVEDGVFYLVHSGEDTNSDLAGLWRTRDGGAHWEKIFQGEIAPASRFSAKLRAVPGKAGHLFFTSAVAGVSDSRLRRSVDGGVNWTIVAGVDRVDDIGFGKGAGGSTYPTIFLSGQVSGEYGIWRSSDDAATWKRVGRFPVGSLDQVTVVEGDKDRFGRVYLGYEGSGWIFGEPAACSEQPYHFPAVSECDAIFDGGLVDP